MAINLSLEGAGECEFRGRSLRRFELHLRRGELDPGTGRLDRRVKRQASPESASGAPGITWP